MQSRAHLRLVHSQRSRVHIEPDHAGPGIGYALFLCACFTALVVGMAVML